MYLLLSSIYSESRWCFRKNVGARVAMDVSNDIMDKGFYLYFDNYFSSPSLMSEYWQEILTVLVLCECEGNISLSLGNEILMVWKRDNHYPGKFYGI